MNTNNTELTDDDLGFIQIALTKVLAAAARGLDKNGTWVGFDKAAKIHNV